MASTAAPYGLRLTNMQGSQVATHGMRLMPIHVQPASPTATYATSIFNGDPVEIDATTGYIVRSTVAAAAIPIGVFVGCEYEDSNGLLHKNWWTGSTVTKAGTTAWAYVIDDPDALFEIQAAGSITQAMLGANGDFVLTAGNTSHGRSSVALATTTPTTAATRPLRIVDFVRRAGCTVGDAYTDVIVRINTHQNRATLGV